MSHLLTHISSKSHLAHRFKLEIRSQGEAGAKETLNNYDLWYKENNLEALLTERHAIKEEKKVSRQKRDSTKNKRTTRQNVIVKKEVKKEPSTEQDDIDESLASTPRFTRRGPRMTLWPTVPKPRALQSPSPLRVPHRSPTATYESPTLRRPVPNFSLQETPHTASLGHQTPLQTKYKNSEDSEKSGPESAKLKGIFWPGMNLFDSATPEMKRMRNQRKDVSVLHSMMATSVGIQPLEVSYTPNGGYRSSRDIFGPLSDFEITPQKTVPTPKKRKARKPAVLRDISVNVPRLRTRNIPRLRAPEAQMTGQSPVKRQRTRKPRASKPSFTATATRNPFASMGNSFLPSAEETEEFRLTVGDMGRKRDLNIFQDEPSATPARSETPLDDFMTTKFGNGSENLLAYNTNFSPQGFIASEDLPKSTMFRSHSRENEELDMKERYSAMLATGSGHILPSMIFKDPSSNPLYNQATMNPFTFGTRQEGVDMDFKPPFSNFGDYQAMGPFDGLNVPDYRNDLVNPGQSSADTFGHDGDEDFAYTGQYRL
ncbi:hypothetical protein PVAG01_10938 [Phlyctema vagabunda]|uniref:Uncharacterized protein n=1 Tax=Phlyctema vagabunda TaxID=108571 RepID=A0ABR4P3P6_9HELO